MIADDDVSDPNPKQVQAYRLNRTGPRTEHRIWNEPCETPDETGNRLETSHWGLSVGPVTVVAIEP